MENLLSQTSSIKWFIMYLYYETVKVLVTLSCPTLCNLMDYSPLASMEFSKWEYWSELPFLSPGHLPNPGIEPASLALAGGFFTAWAIGEANKIRGDTTLQVSQTCTPELAHRLLWAPGGGLKVQSPVSIQRPKGPKAQTPWRRTPKQARPQDTHPEGML